MTAGAFVSGGQLDTLKNVTTTFSLSPIHQSDTKYFLVVSGFAFTFSGVSCHSVEIDNVSPTLITVRWVVNCGNSAKRVVFYVVAVNPSELVWMTNFEAYPQNISILNSPDKI
jgi:hypothetical protein